MANATSHSFNVDLATKYGVHEAIILNHIMHWIAFNERAKKNFHEGKYWMYETLKDMANHFPYFSFKQVRTALDNLVKKGAIIKSNFSKNKFDVTIWYALEDKCILPNGQIPFAQMGKCINKETDTETDTEKKRTAKAEAGASVSDAARRLVNIFIEKIKERDPNFKEPNLKKWALVFDRMHRIDGRSYEEIEKLLLFSQGHEFWSGVILSPESFRKATSKLFMQYNAAIAKTQPETRKESKWKENAAYAKEMASLDEDRIFVDETTITIVINRNRKENCVIPFNEEGFHEQLGSALRKAGII